MSVIDTKPSVAPIPIEIHPKFHPLMDVRHSFANIFGGRGGMKCLALGTRVIMANGERRSVERVNLGDQVMGPDSKPRTVTAVSSGFGPMFKVSQTSAMDYVVNNAHVLSLKKSLSATNDTRLQKNGNLRNPRGRYPHDSAITNIGVSDFVGKSERWRSHFRGYRAGPLHFKAQDVQIDPYFLGLWLGDGHSYSPRLFNEDQEIIDWCHAYAQREGQLLDDAYEAGRCRCLAFSVKASRKRNLVWTPFKTYGLVKNKHIPQAYLCNSEEVRLKVLAGLIDTDGHYRADRRCFAIQQVNERLAHDLKYLADTLGFRTSMKQRRTRCANNGAIGAAWCISISGPIWKIPCLVKRKQPPKDEFRPNKDQMLSMVSVQRVADGAWAGFEIDGDHLFLLEDGTVTHNSEQTHKVALLEAIRRPLRVCNARETMASIKDSSHKLLSDAIYQHGMAKSQNGPYEIQESRILRKDGDRIASEFIFIGIRENVRDQKSLKGIDLTIVEEAAKVSQDSLDVLIPTVMGRVEDSRMWFIWNPELVTDPVHRMFLVNRPPTGTIHINTSYLENPWLTETMRILAEDCQRDDPEKYAHIWLGKPLQEVQGAIFGAELRKALETGRIGEIPYNQLKPVTTVWDLGFGDPTAIWFVQAYDGYYNFIDYLESTDETTADYVIKLQNRGYVYDTDWLPHDGIDTIIHKKLSGITDRTKSIEMLLRNARRNVRIVPKIMLTDQINAARLVLNQCRFDEKKCAKGIEALRHYQWDTRPVKDTDRPAEGETKMRGPKPLHNWASHASSAFMGAAIAVKQPEIEYTPPLETPRVTGDLAWMS